MVKMLLYYFDSNIWQKIKKYIFENKNYFRQIMPTLKNEYNEYGKADLFDVLSDDYIAELYCKFAKMFPFVYKPYPTGTCYTPDPLKDLFNDIPNYFMNNGKVKSFKKIKTLYLKNCIQERKKSVFKNCL